MNETGIYSFNSGEQTDLDQGEPQGIICNKRDYSISLDSPYDTQAALVLLSSCGAVLANQNGLHNNKIKILNKAIFLPGWNLIKIIYLQNPPLSIDDIRINIYCQWPQSEMSTKIAQQTINKLADPRDPLSFKQVQELSYRAQWDYNILHCKYVSLTSQICKHSCRKSWPLLKIKK